MTTTPIIFRSVAAVAASLFTMFLSVAAMAEEPLVIRGDQEPIYQERVTFTELDLRRSGDRQALKTRVRRAAERICREAEGPIPDVAFAGGLNCADLTYKDARTQIIAAFQRAKEGQQVATTLVLSVPRETR